MARIYLTSENAIFSLAGTTTVNVTLKDGTELGTLEPRYMFPITRQDSYITMVDNNQKERAVIKHLDDLGDDSRKLVADCLDEFYHIPKILSINSIKDMVACFVFDVETTRGNRVFEIYNVHQQIKNLDNNRVVFRDRNDNRYEITDFTKLDKKSRKMFDVFV